MRKCANAQIAVPAKLIGAQILCFSHWNCTRSSHNHLRWLWPPMAASWARRGCWRSPEGIITTRNNWDNLPWWQRCRLMRGYALNVHTRIKIINVAWARTMIQLGQVASSTHLNSPSLLSRPPVVAALPLVLPWIILLLTPGGQRPPPSSTRVSGARGKDKCCCQHYQDV
jgi:hypothetical protein